MVLTRFRNIFRLTMLVLLGLVITCPPDSAAQTKPSPNIDRVLGAYKLSFAGYYTGEGNGTVTPKTVMIRGRVTNDDGSTGNFFATCKRDGNHFSGTGSGPGVSVKVTGRLDPANKRPSASRLTCTYVASSGQAGRVAGVHHRASGQP